MTAGWNNSSCRETEFFCSIPLTSLHCWWFKMLWHQAQDQEANASRREQEAFFSLQNKRQNVVFTFLSFNNLRLSFPSVEHHRGKSCQDLTSWSNILMSMVSFYWRQPAATESVSKWLLCSMSLWSLLYSTTLLSLCHSEWGPTAWICDWIMNKWLYDEPSVFCQVFPWILCEMWAERQQRPDVQHQLQFDDQLNLFTDSFLFLAESRSFHHWLHLHRNVFHFCPYSEISLLSCLRV